MLAQLSSHLNMIKRPEYGQVGKEVTVVTNFFKINLNPTVPSVLYSLDFDPKFEDGESRVRDAVIDANKDLINTLLGSSALISNGGTLYAVGATNPLDTLTVQYKGNEHKITFKMNKDLDTTNIRTPEQAMFINILVKKLIKTTQMQPMGRFYYNVNDVIQIPEIEKYTLFRGFYSSTQLVDIGLTLNMDVKHRVLQKLNILEIIRQTRTEDHNFLRDDLRYRVVMTTLSKNNANCHRLYRVEDIEWHKTPKDTFTLEKKGVAEQITFAEYFKRFYGVEVAPDQPLIIVKDSRKNSELKLPASLCYLTGLDAEAKSNFRLMQKMATITRMSPGVRLKLIQDMVRKIKTSSEAVNLMQKFQFDISEEAISANAQQVQDPRIINKVSDLQVFIQSKGASVESSTRIPNADFTPCLQEGILGCPPNIPAQMIAIFSPDQESTQKLMRGIGTDLGSCAPFKVNQPVVHHYSGRDSVKNLILALPGKPHGIIVVLPSNQTAANNIYKEVKNFCNDNLIYSQFVKSGDKNGLKTDSTMRKLAQQFIVKAGGALWTVPALKGNQPTMIVGISTQAGGAAQLGQAWVSLCASLDFTLTRYLSAAYRVVSKENTSSAINVFMEMALREYARFSSCKPLRIIVYREGISQAKKHTVSKADLQAIHYALDGKVSKVEETTNDPEMDKLNSTANALNLGVNSSRVEVVYLSVNREVNQRFGIMSGANIENAKNPMPLTVIDGTITNKEAFDFYVCHQQVNNGASLTPTHYDVVQWSKSSQVPPISATELQKLTVDLSMAYSNWSGPIRLPAPVMYANKQLKQWISRGAIQASASFDNQASVNFSETLYYL